MTVIDSGARRGRSGGRRDATFRWVCPCEDPPFLLATCTAEGRVNIKVRDRYWHVFGQVRTSCPRCGAEHVLDLRAGDDGTNSPDASIPVLLPPLRGSDAGK